MSRTTPGTVLVTGATSGIGQATTVHLAEAGWTVLAHGREPAGAERACRALAQAVPGARVEPLAADLGSLAEVTSLARQVADRPDGLDALVNNAGLFLASDDPTRRRTSADGFELTWAVNHLAALALALDLVSAFGDDRLRHVVNLSSGMHLRADIAWEDPDLRRGWDGRVAYAQSKLALTACAVELAHRRPAGPAVTAVSPGYVDTRLVRAAFGGPALPPAVGGWHVARLLIEDPFPGVQGAYVDRVALAEPHPLVGDAAARDRLWELSTGQLAAARDRARQ
ncbi:SDR family NAD(P)-dependent oxidoreductase [Micromonospora sp. NPDC049101]|uniref:SDR family NAD(P)-dependent oxidoreductase n=1 Tax=Micromonospora sp. NPDC049101 TaxID=3155032 RepID=UPI00340AEC2E